MAQNTKIEWTDHTLNLWWGCTEVHSGCDNCYTRELAKTRFKNDIWGLDSPRVEKPNAFKELAKWQKIAEKEGVKKYVFCSSMSDIFEKSMPVIRKGVLQEYQTQTLRNRLFQEIDENKYPNLIFQFLTKRPINIPKMIPNSWANGAPQNVMFGTSISAQKDERLIAQLLEVKGKKFLSIEPLLESVDLKFVSNYCDACSAKRKPTYQSKIDCNGCKRNNVIVKNKINRENLVDWVIVGGESGSNARPTHPDWVRSIRDQCQEAGVPFFFKQWGEYGYAKRCLEKKWSKTVVNQISPTPLEQTQFVSSFNEFEKTQIHLAYEAGQEFPMFCQKLGKKAAGNLLDGVIYNEFPKF